MRKIRTFFYVLRQGVVNIFRNKWFSMASLATISSCLFLLGLFFAVVLNFQNIVHTAEQGVSVTIFFESGTTEEVMKQIGKHIESRDEVAKVEFTSAEEAWEYYKENFIPEEYVDGFPEDDNPLADSASFEIYLKDVSKQDDLVQYLEGIPEIRTVNKSEVVATTLTGMNALVAYASGAIILILLLVSVFLINNTVAIGIHVRREEIGIMKTIGATDFFVRGPFVIEGMLIGGLGSVVPLLLIYKLYGVVLEYIDGRFNSLANLLQFLPVETIFVQLIPMTVGVGVGIGLIGSMATVRKHLRV